MTTSPQDDTFDSNAQPERLDALIRDAQAGSGSASCRLGDLYLKVKGEGVAQDWEEAFRWYSQGAAEGDAEAQSNRG